MLDIFFAICYSIGIKNILEVKMVELTEHAYERWKKRCKGNRKSLEKSAQKAYDSGKRSCDFSKETRVYLDNLLKQSHGNSVRVYANFVYIFYDTVLITLFPLNTKLLKKEIVRGQYD